MPAVERLNETQAKHEVRQCASIPIKLPINICWTLQMKREKEVATTSKKKKNKP